MNIKRYPMPMPYGWFQVAYSHELKPGEAKPIRYFGKDMVLFRTESGEASCLDAFCPHMGAHLGYGIHEFAGKGGEVQAENIVCPFHGWKFNTQGVCEDIPYAKNIPPKVKDKECIKRHNLVERNQCIWVWYHPEDKAPMWEVETIAEANSDEWSDVQVHRRVIKTHIQEIAENGADHAHFHFVHGTAEMPQVTRTDFDGHYRSLELTSKLDTPKGKADGRIELKSFGPGQAVTYFEGICDTVLMGNVSHIEDELIEVNFGFLQKKVDGKVPEGGVNAAIIADICQQIEEDAPIWENKIYQPKPNLCDGDGPIAKFRKWYTQFYVGYEG